IVRDRVWVTGAVNNAGVFEWSPGLRLDALLERADGLTDAAYRPRILIYRRDPADGSRALLRTSADGQDPAAIALVDGDSVVVLDRTELANETFVSIDGFVKEPGEYAFAEQMTVRDLVLAAGGFVPGANTSEAELSR